MKALFLAALERPEAERAEWLRGEAGGDARLVERVESLLELHAEADRLEGCGPALATEPPRAARRPGESAGDTVGRYRLDERIREAGLGTVWRASPRRPGGPPVAAKIVDVEADARYVVARFAAQRAALARIDHPSIAQVIDCGVTETGRPCFVSEFVEGAAITDHCDRERLDVAQRLALFEVVCRAVQHAHTKGVVHRELKPCAVLVARRDGADVPVIVDFGIAGATHAELVARARFSEYSHLIGSPLYMSPEQARMVEANVDARTDVYSLGVLLYQLLTGTTPFAIEDLLVAGPDGMQRILCERDAERASTRVHAMGAERLAVAARRRRTTGRRLRRRLRGDLDRILARALARDPERRYPTPDALATDLSRHMRGLPIEA